jgi:hypothetical protein
MKGGIIVRLIDVVFILLLGFISASDIIRKTQIKLPKQLVSSMRQEVKEPRPLVVRIFVAPKKVMTDADFNIIRQNLKSTGKKAKKEKNKFTQRWVSEHYVSYFVRTGAAEDDPQEEIESIDALENYIISQYRNRLIPGQKMIILIIPHPDAMLQGVVNIFDICRRYKLEYSFRIQQARERLQELEI